MSNYQAGSGTYQDEWQSRLLTGVPRQPTSVTLTADHDQWQGCLKRDIEQRVADAWGSDAAAGKYPTPKATATGVPGATGVPDLSQYGSRPIVEPALRKCFPSAFDPAGACYETSPNPSIAAYGYVCDSRLRLPEDFADSAYHEAWRKYLDEEEAVIEERNHKKTVEDQAILKQEEPAVLANYRNCIFGNAALLALLSDEPASVIVSATYAACRPQRQAFIDLHRSHGDPGFDDERMDKIQDRVAGALILTVIQARSGEHVRPPSQVPPVSSPLAAPGVHSI